ncbi:MAG TPA: hypothetical protein VMV50_02090 [Candidatus Paceibacterota bacterium]|nr:hypothetical protein [Candidatus Paceibacterota bacterium]
MAHLFAQELKDLFVQVRDDAGYGSFGNAASTQTRHERIRIDKAEKQIAHFLGDESRLIDMKLILILQTGYDICRRLSAEGRSHRIRSGIVSL